jgi:type II secretion system protein D
MNFKAASWQKVLNRVARHSGLMLVMKHSPPGTFTRADLNLYTVAEAIWVMNRELEPAGYRVVRQGDFLMVLDLDDLRSDYRPSVARRLSRDDDNPQSTTGVKPASAQEAAPGDPAVAPALLETVAPETGREGADNPKDKGDDPENDEIASRRIRLAFFATPWTTVLPRVAKEAGLILVMKRCPSGSLNHPDFRKFTVPEAIQFLNHELDDTNFRLIRQDKFLIVLYTEDLRVEYDRPVVRVRRKPQPRDDDSSDARTPPATNSDIRQVSATVDVPAAPGQAVGRADFGERGRTASLPVNPLPESETGQAGSLSHESSLPLQLDSEPDSNNTQPGQADRVSPASASEPVNPPWETENGQAGSLSHEGPMLLDTGVSPAAASAPAPAPAPASASASAAGSQAAVFVPQHGTAADVAQHLYAALRGRTELLTPGLKGLPSFRVYDAPDAHKRAKGHASPGTKPALFTVGLDTDHNRLLIEAPRRRLPAVIRLCERIDAHGEGTGTPLELVTADAKTCAVAKNLGPELNRLLAQRGAAGGAADNGGQSSGQSAGQSVASPPATAIQTVPPTGAGEKGISEIIKGLKGDVTVESVPELGILILRGGQSDVDAVMKVIREIERLSVGSTPQIHLLQLQYVNSESFAKLLNEVYKALSASRTEGAGGGKQLIQVFSVVKPNAVLVLAPPADMPSVLKLAGELDQPVNPELEFQVFRLRYGYAANVATSVNNFYKSPRALGTSVNVFADARTNSLIIQARPRDLAEVGRLIEKLDGPTASQATIKVFPLQNGDATAIQRLLETLFGTAQGRTGANQQAPPEESGTETTAPTALRLSVDIRTNTIIALGPPDTLRAVEAVIIRLDNSDVHQRKTTVIRLKNNASDNVARAITDFVRSQRDLQQIEPEAMSNVELLEREVFVVSEPISNSLLLSATPRYFDDLTKMINKLDAPPAQVIIQALIVEVELDNTDEFGIELGFQSPVLFDRSNISNLTTLQTTTTVNPTTTVAQNVLLSSQSSPGFQFGDPSSGLGTNPANGAAAVGTQELTNLGLGRTDSTLGFGGLVLAASSESVSALLRALSYKQTIHVLSRPQIRTLDNRMASIQVGKRVPVIYSATTNAVTGTISPLVQYDNAGIILTVQPRITPDGMIALEAYAEKSQYELTGGVTLLSTVGGPSIQSPIKDITRAEASVNVASGNTVVMGGMITSSDTSITRKVPWIADVPIIGQAFRYDSKATVRTELLIFLTPRVIRDDADDEMIKQVETERIHFLVDEAESMHGPILSNRPPVLEECPPEGLPVTPLMPVPGSMRPAPELMGPSLPGTTLPGTTLPGTTLPGTTLPGTLTPGPFTPGTMQPGTLMPAPSLPIPPPPVTPPVPLSPQTAPVLPPPAIPPVGSRMEFNLTPASVASAPFGGSPSPANFGPPVSRPISGVPANVKPASLSQPADETGAVRAASFEGPAWENDK